VGFPTAREKKPARWGKSKSAHGYTSGRTSFWWPQSSSSCTTLSGAELCARIDQVEAGVRSAVPIARLLFIEPDVLSGPAA